MSKKHLCPACGFDKLREEPFDKRSNQPSYEVCPCCGFEFGFDGDNYKKNFSEYREKWIADGAQWFVPQLKPNNWNYHKQLENLK